jgi:nucleolar pre-ribosomal-associated protein 1
MTLLSFHYTDYALGQPVMKTLLNHANMRRLHFYIGGSHNELILVTLKLFNVMSKFAAGQYRKTILESFPWELKVRSYLVIDGYFVHSCSSPSPNS